MILTKPHAPKLVPFPKTPLPVRDERILANMSLADLAARSIAKSLPPSFEFDELRSAGYIGLLHAAEKYQTTFKVPFPRYARARINNAIWEYVRRSNWFNATMEPLNDAGLHLVDRSETAERQVERLEQQKAVNAAVASLPDREAQVVRLVCIQGAGVVSTGKRLGVHHTRVTQIKQAAIPKMRRYFALRGRTAA